MVYTSQYLEISTFQIKTVVYWKNQTINNFKASESNVIQISYNSDNNENCFHIAGNIWTGQRKKGSLLLILLFLLSFGRRERREKESVTVGDFLESPKF